MEFEHRFFGDFVPAPDRLDDVHAHIEREIAALRQPWYPPTLHNELLLSGSALVGTNLSQWSSFPDASAVARDQGSVKRYLECLVAPDTVEDLREVICDCIMDYELDVIAKDLIDLHKFDPDATTALMELRLGRGFARLKKVEDQKPFQKQSLVDRHDLLIRQMTLIRIAYMLRMIATDCARQIHKP